MEFKLVNHLWKLIKNFLFDYKLLKYIDWKKRQNKFIKYVIPKIPIINILEDTLEGKVAYWYYCGNYGTSIKDATNTSWRTDSIRVGAILSLPIEPYENSNLKIIDRHYYVHFYDINNIPNKYL
jgi:hypothetical protein